MLMTSPGGLAQLVERLLCKQDASGSSPLLSILSIMSSANDSTKVLLSKRRIVLITIIENFELMKHPEFQVYIVSVENL